MKTLQMILSVSVLAVASGYGQGTILWDESFNGQLSEDPALPTILSPMQLGTNSVIGSTEVVPTPPNWAGHPNIFTFQVPSGSAVQALYLQVDKPNVWAWIGNPGFSADLAYVLNAGNGNLLSQWGLVPVQAGAYGMYLENHDQQVFTSIANFRLDFVLQTVPEPGVVWFIAVGLIALGLRRPVVRGR